MGTLYVSRYIQKGIRTDITFKEQSQIDLPAISFCLEGTFYSNFPCYNNTTFHYFRCNTTKVPSEMLFDDGNSREQLTDVGENCHLFGANKTYSIAPEKQ